jgi:hypothetical protein
VLMELDVRCVSRTKAMLFALLAMQAFMALCSDQQGNCDVCLDCGTKADSEARGTRVRHADVSKNSSRQSLG